MKLESELVFSSEYPNLIILAHKVIVKNSKLIGRLLIAFFIKWSAEFVFVPKNLLQPMLYFHDESFVRVKEAMFFVQFTCKFLHFLFFLGLGVFH